MKSKPVVMEHFSTIHTSFIVDFTFTNNLTILMGDSGTGKTATTSFIRECMAINPKILCFNYLDYQKNIKDIISQENGKLIVISGRWSHLRTGAAPPQRPAPFSFWGCSRDCTEFWRNAAGRCWTACTRWSLSAPARQ